MTEKLEFLGCMSAATRSISPWNNSPGKRLFDVAVAIVLLALVSPLLIVIAVVLKLTSAGPVFFCQERMGKNGRPFRIVKFRTMTHDPNGGGPKITRAGDARVTPIGRVLRKWKLDELPQLFNVILGDMSFVGPRPDLPEYVGQLTPPQSEIVLLRPGITGMASIRYRDEEQVLATVKPEELPQFYCTHVLCNKADIDLDYAQRADFLSDVGVLLSTAKRMFG